MSDYLFRGPYIKVPVETIQALSNKELGTLVRRLIEEDKARRRRRRNYIPPRVWLPILEAFNYRCAYCGAAGIPLEKDHRIPVSKGGTDDPENLVPACKPCNVRKYNHDPAEWPVR